MNSAASHRVLASGLLFSLARLGFEADDVSVPPYCLQESKRNPLLHDPVTTWGVIRKLDRAVNHRILRLYKISKIIKTKRRPKTTMSTKPCPKCHVYRFFEHLQGWSLHHLSGSLFQCLTTLLVKKCFLISNLNPPLIQLKTISSCPFASYLGEETNTHPATTSFQVVVESNKVSTQPPLLQAK